MTPAIYIDTYRFYCRASVRKHRRLAAFSRENIWNEGTSLLIYFTVMESVEGGFAYG